jgi:hypothetical protein
MGEIEVNHEVSASSACSLEEGDKAVDVLTGEGGQQLEPSAPANYRGAI